MKKNQTEFLKLCLADALIKLMETQDFELININAICKEADVGRTTFYRHLDNKRGKEELLVFKVKFEWKRYVEIHVDEAKKDKGFTLLKYIYENKRLFTLLNKNGLIIILMSLVEDLVTEGWEKDKKNSYLVAYFAYGYFGVIFQWIKYAFDETPEQVQKNISQTLMTGIKNQ